MLSPKLARDDGFAARFYRAIAMFLAHWVNHAIVRVGQGGPPTLLAGVAEQDEIPPEALTRVSLAGARFVSLLTHIGES